MRTGKEEYMTIARMEKLATPQWAARVLARTFMLRAATARDDHLDKIDAGDGHHLAFVYALSAVARRA